MALDHRTGKRMATLEPLIAVVLSIGLACAVYAVGKAIAPVWHEPTSATIETRTIGLQLAAQRATSVAEDEKWAADDCSLGTRPDYAH